MLPPFRVRNLRRSISSPSGPSPSNLSIILDDHPLVRITAPQYDSTISEYPDAKLRYLDDDDGEIVTVGTSLELSQRLQEPPSQCPHPQQGHHIFDVDRKETSVKVWQSLAGQETETGSAVGRTEPESGHNPLDQGTLRLLGQETSESSPPTSFLRDVVSDGPTKSEVKSYCEQYIEACNPPRVIPPQDAGREPLRMFDTAKLGSNPATVNLLMGATSLTAEGQRQAQAAGDRMRASRYSGRTTAVTESSPRANYQNRWATYNRSTPSFSVANGMNSIEPQVSSSRSRRQAQAAGDRIRNRSSRIKQSQSKSNECNEEAMNRSSFMHNSPRSVHFDVESNHAISTSRLPAAKSPVNNTKSESLLEVFESEFSKDSKHGEFVGFAPNPSPSSPNSAVSAAQLWPSVPPLSTPLDEQNSKDMKVKRLSPNPRPDQQNTHLIKQSVDDIASVMLHIRTQASSSEGNLLTKQVCLTLENALDSALYELKTCLTKIAESAKDTVKLTLTESQYHQNQESEKSSQTSQYFPQKATTSAQSDSHAQPSAAGRSTGEPCKVPSALLRPSQGGEATHSGSNVDMSSSSSYEPKGSAFASFKTNQGHPPRSDRKPMEYKFPSEVNAGARLQEQKVAPSLNTSSPSSCELPVIKDHATVNYDLNLAMALSGRFTPDNDKSAKLIEAYQTKTQISDSQILPSLSETKSLLPAQNALYPRGYNVPKVNTFNSHDVMRSLRSRPSNSERPIHYRPRPLSTHEEGAQPLSTDLVSHHGTTYRDELCGSTLRRVIGPSADASQSHASEVSALYHEPRRTLDGLRRSVTVASSNDKYTISSSRPYSTNFDGSCRMRWDSTPQQKALCVEESSAKNIRTVGGRPKSVQGRTHNHAPGSFSQDTYAAEHADVTTAGKVQECVEQLRKLGFGSHVEGSVQRLVIYAQAADGDLVEAIDMIDEEQRAYQQRY